MSRVLNIYRMYIKSAKHTIAVFWLRKKQVWLFDRGNIASYPDTSIWLYNSSFTALFLFLLIFLFFLLCFFSLFSSSFSSSFFFLSSSSSSFFSIPSSFSFNYYFKIIPDHLKPRGIILIIIILPPAPTLSFFSMLAALINVDSLKGKESANSSVTLDKLLLQAAAVAVCISLGVFQKTHPQHTRGILPDKLQVLWIFSFNIHSCNSAHL